MRILVFTSRYTATRDIISEDFGRQVRLFEQLRKFGHKIDFFCVDYRKFENKNLILHKMKILIRPFKPIRLFGLLSDLEKAIKDGNYDLMIATSDPLWGVLGYFYAKKHHIKFLYDLHDNYEVYKTYKIPLFGLIDRKIIKKADIVTTVSNTLKKKISDLRREKVFVIENGADLDLFKPKNRLKSRKMLNLPLNAKIIAYSGTIQKIQGIGFLVGAFDTLKKNVDNLYLVLAGRKRIESEKLDLDDKNIIWLKELDQKGVVDLINAADVAVVPNTTNEFTRYCFPYKIIEYMACNSKIVSTNVGDIGNILQKDSLCKPGNVNDLVEKIRLKLNSTKKTNYRKIARRYSWYNIAKKLDNIIRNN